MAIEATELQMEVKGFLRDTNAAYLETLELIHAGFRVQTTGEHIRDTMTRSGSTVRRGKTDDDVNPKKTDAPLNRLDHSPTIVASSYPQSTTNSSGSGTKYFPASRVTALLKISRGSKFFKFSFNVAQHGVWPRKNQRNDTRHDGASRQNWNSGGGGQKDSRDCGWDQVRAEHRRDFGSDRGSYQGNRNNRGNSTTRRRVGFGDPDRSPESTDSH